jgi:Xylose isomerase-like TIM barrel
MELVRSSISIVSGLPCVTVRSAPAIIVSGPAQRSLTLWPARSRGRLATLSIESSDSFVASTAVSIATGWNEPVPGRELHPLKSSAFHGALLRAIRDINMPNVGVGFDTANLILYGKANPVDAIEMLGPHVRSVHAKDGKWPTDPSKLGEEVLIGKGVVDFKRVFTKLHQFGYTGAITIERETSGLQQIEDVKNEKLYLQRILDEVLS